MKRRNFITITGATALAAGTIPMQSFTFEDEKKYYHQGRTAGYKDFRIIDEGSKIKSIESYTKGAFSLVKVTTDNGKTGWGQISTYDADISAMVMHRKVAPFFLGKDPAKIDELCDNAVEFNHKYPWSFINRALGGIDTAIWDLYGNIKEKPVAELLGAKSLSHKAYGSSMRRDISPEDEAKRIAELQQKNGFEAFKIRIGSSTGRNKDASPGRTGKIIPMIRKTIGWNADLLADANSCYTPDKAIEVGKILEQNKAYQYEEPCPWWELEWTKEVTDAVNVSVSGGEQDNDLAQWRRMTKMKAIDIAQPDVLYLGGITRTYRAAMLASEAGITCVPHSANHGLVTLFALHLLCALPNAEKYLEYSIETEEGVNKEAERIFGPRLKVTDGKVSVPDEPGWGVQISKDWLEKADYQKSEA